MTIELLDGKYILKPYQTNGMRCWELYVGNRSRPDCYPDTLGSALRWVAEHEIRNGGDQNDLLSLGEALGRYERICESLADTALGALSGDSA